MKKLIVTIIIIIIIKIKNGKPFTGDEWPRGRHLLWGPITGMAELRRWKVGQLRSYIPDHNNHSWLVLLLLTS